jgi:hypothetical protein
LDINKYNAQAGNTMYTNPWGAALGGGLGLAQIGNMLGWWGGNP